MIFLTHAWANKPVARRMCETFVEARIPVWLDETELEPDQSLRTTFLEAIGNSAVYLYLASVPANEARWVKDELTHALSLESEGKLKILTVRVSEPDGILPPVLAG